MPVSLKYLLDRPPGYERKKRWPLLFFLHGKGELGSDLKKVRIHGPPKIVAAGDELPFVVVSPQSPQIGWNVRELNALLDEVMKLHRIDPDRVYLTGLSMGGSGTWEFAAAYPDRFAAIVPICGKGEPDDAGKLKGIPVWAFHGALDKTVRPKHSQIMVKAIQKAGGNAKLTIYPNTNHDSWTQTYNNPGLYKWLLQHRRKPSKRPRRGRRILSFREAAQWDEERIRRFEEEQRRKREWISFVEIAEWYSDLAGPVSPKKAAALREQAYRMLESDLLERRFEEDGRFVLFLHPGVSLTHWKMTTKRYQQARENNLDNEQGRSYLRHCWLPRSLFEHWCAWHNLPKSPPRFQPSQDSRARVSPDERSDLNTQPSKPPNRGGRPPAVDWEALKDALAEEIKSSGFPDRTSPPGWRSTKDVADWVETKLGKEAEHVARRTIEDNVRKMISELRASMAKMVSR
jgi:pimeloyl-ACP methyl ester carboxylesterase